MESTGVRTRIKAATGQRIEPVPRDFIEYNESLPHIKSRRVQGLYESLTNAIALDRHYAANFLPRESSDERKRDGYNDEQDFFSQYSKKIGKRAVSAARCRRRTEPSQWVGIQND
jgi:hypothetical protein